MGDPQQDLKTPQGKEVSKPPYADILKTAPTNFIKNTKPKINEIHANKIKVFVAS